jgi:hypothetical protein
LVADLRVGKLYRRSDADGGEVICRIHTGHEIVHFKPVRIILTVKNSFGAGHQLDRRELRLALRADLPHRFSIDCVHGGRPLLQLQICLLRLREAALSLAVAPLLLRCRLSEGLAGSVVQGGQLRLFYAARN